MFRRTGVFNRDPTAHAYSVTTDLLTGFSASTIPVTVTRKRRRSSWATFSNPATSSAVINACAKKFS